MSFGLAIDYVPLLRCGVKWIFAQPPENHQMPAMFFQHLPSSIFLHNEVDAIRWRHGIGNNLGNVAIGEIKFEEYQFRRGNHLTHL